MYQQLRESEKTWFVFGWHRHCQTKPEHYCICGCPEQLVDIADEDGDVYQAVPLETAEGIIAMHNMLYDG